jgi:threonine dehydrogenase-like Zn-dependent dehydrogenase
MRALCWHGKGDVWVDTVPDPKIQHPRDAVIKITACAICGSDLHLSENLRCSERTPISRNTISRVAHLPADEEG